MILNSEFGEFCVNVRIEDDKVIYTRDRRMNKGVFPAEEYEAFIDFYKKMVKADKMKFVLVKNL